MTANRKTNRTRANAELGDDLRITKTTRRLSGGGTWVSGTIAGYRFEALVFPEHAEVTDYELGDSRISKLWIARLANKETTFNWDRGMDIPAASKKTQAVVDFLAAGLADLVYGATTTAMTAKEKRNAIGSMRAAMHERTDGDALADLSAAELDVEYANTKKAYDRWVANGDHRESTGRPAW